MKKILPLAVSATLLSLLTMTACTESSSGKTRTVSIPAMTVTELMYHPADGYPEFVELTLSGTSLSSMSSVNLRLDGAVEFAFPDESLDKGEVIVVTEDSALFRKMYPDYTGRLFQWNAGFKLSNSGDVLEVKLDGKGDFDARYDNNAPWPSLADGNGSSLVYVGENPAYAESWAASKTVMEIRDPRRILITQRLRFASMKFCRIMWEVPNLGLNFTTPVLPKWMWADGK